MPWNEVRGRSGSYKHRVQPRPVCYFLDSLVLSLQGRLEHRALRIGFRTPQTAEPAEERFLPAAVLESIVCSLVSFLQKNVPWSLDVPPIPPAGAA